MERIAAVALVNQVVGGDRLDLQSLHDSDVAVAHYRAALDLPPAEFGVNDVCRVDTDACQCFRVEMISMLVRDQYDIGFGKCRVVGDLAERVDVDRLPAKREQ